MRVRFLLLTVLCLASVTVPAQAQRTISGRVLTLSRVPLEGATVVLRVPDTGLQRYGTATDSTGRFSLSPIQAGVYELTASYLGFAASETQIDVRESDAPDLLILLHEEALPQGEVLVSVNRTRLQLHPVTFSNITARELERLPEMKDLPVHLARQPSITYYSENGNGIGYSTLRMRGFGQRRLAISINGIPQNDPEEFNVFWVNFFDIQGAVEDIQIQRGAGSSVYGPAAIGGAVNIRAMPYRPTPHVRAEVGGGSFDTQRYSLEVNSGLFNRKYIVFSRLSRLLSAGYRDGSWSRFWRFFAGVTRYGERSSLTIQVFGGPQRDGLAYSGIPKQANKRTITDGFGSTIDRKYNYSAFDGDVESFHQPHIELHHELRLSENASLSQAVFWIQGKGYFDFGGTFRSADYLRLPEGFVSAGERALPLYVSKPDASVLFRAFLDQWQVGWLPGVTFRSDRNTLRLGAELRLHRSLRWGRIQRASGVPEELVGSRHDVRVYSFRGEKAIASVMATTLFRPTDLWAIQGDIQLTTRSYRVYDERFFGNEFRVPYMFLNPRLGVTYRPEQDVSVYASAALANREPRLKSLYDGEEAGAGFVPAFRMRSDGSLDTGSPLVDSEQLMDVEVGLRIQRERFHGTFNLFFMDFHDEIVPSGGLDQYGVPRTGNADHTRHAGIEMDAAVRLTRGVDLGGNMTISRNRFISFDEYTTLPDFSTRLVSQNGHAIAGFPDISGNVDATVSLGALVGNVHASFVGKQYIDNNQGRDAAGVYSNDLVNDAFMLMDLSLRYTFGNASQLNGLKLSLDVNNVLDDRVLMFGNVGAAGPQFFPAATRHAFLAATYTLR